MKLLAVGKTEVEGRSEAARLGMVNI